MTVNIASLCQPLLLSVYKCLEAPDIGNVMLTSKYLKNSTNSDAFWAYLVKRDLTDQEFKLEEGKSYKQIYLENKSFLDEIAGAIEDIAILNSLDTKGYDKLTEEEHSVYHWRYTCRDDHYHLLHRAASLGYEKCIDTIMKNIDAKIDAFNPCVFEKGITALGLAAKTNQVHCIEKLISYGADINISDEYGLTPLCFAVIHGSLEAVKFLLKKGANAKSVEAINYDDLDNFLDKFHNCDPDKYINCDIKTRKEIMNLITAYNRSSNTNQPVALRNASEKNYPVENNNDMVAFDINKNQKVVLRSKICRQL